MSRLNSVPHCVESFDSHNSSDSGRATRVLTVFEVQPGNEMQGFHREDMFWPYAIPTFSATAIQFPCASELTLGVLLRCVVPRLSACSAGTTSRKRGAQTSSGRSMISFRKMAVRK